MPAILYRSPPATDAAGILNAKVVSGSTRVSGKTTDLLVTDILMPKMNEGTEDRGEQAER